MEPSAPAAAPSPSPSPAEDEGILTVNFRCLDGRTFTLELPSDIDIADVVSLAAEAADWPDARVRLIYQGRALAPGRTLESCDVKSGHTVHVVKQAQPEGGGRPRRPSPMQPAAGGRPAGAPAPPHGPSFLANSIGQAVSAVAASVSSAAQAAAAATSAAQAASNAVAALRGRTAPALSPAGESASRGASLDGSRDDRGAAGSWDSNGSTAGGVTRSTAADSARMRSSAASSSPSERCGSFLSALLGREGPAGAGGGGPLAAEEARGAYASAPSGSGGSGSSTAARDRQGRSSADFYSALSGALEAAAHSLLRAAEQVRRDASARHSDTLEPEAPAAAPGQGGASLPAERAPRGALPERLAASAAPPAGGRPGAESPSSAAPGAQAASGAATARAGQPLLEFGEQPTPLLLPGGLPAHVLPVAVHVSVEHQTPRSGEGGDSALPRPATGDSPPQTQRPAGGDATRAAETSAPSPLPRPQELVITHEFVQSLLPWTDLRDSLELIHRETGWNPVQLPRVSTQTGAPPPLSVFLPAYFTALNLVAAMLQQFIGWQQGVTRVSVPTVGRSALTLARLSATTAGLSALLTSLFNSMARHVNQEELAEAMAWETESAEGGADPTRASRAAAAARAAGGDGERRPREGAGDEAERRRRRLAADVASAQGLDGAAAREEREKKEENEREEDLERNSEQQWQDVEDEAAAAFGESSSLPVSPLSSRASPRASAPSVVSLISSNAATAGSSSSSTEARDALLAAMAGASTGSAGSVPSPLGARPPLSMSNSSASPSPSPASGGLSPAPALLTSSSGGHRKDDDDESFGSSVLAEQEESAVSGNGAAHALDDAARRGAAAAAEGTRGGAHPQGALQNFVSALGRAHGGDAGAEDQIVDEEVRMRLQMWTGNAQQFSRNVLSYARPRPFSSAYRSGDATQASSMRTASGEAVDNMLPLTWHRALNRVNVGEEPRPPASLSPGYLALLMREAATAARGNGDFAMQQERFPHIRLALQLLEEAERPRDDAETSERT
ncbi:ubiquitin family protein [Besnoitia besnoiti]|uniref:Ubiquitin family protein n=1 Tax=Besnoitia besnoiti TaxID=94643 RepID=A0A2A9MF68_BESBE|nr:ubiquitin family protein [Besnoitia besnoiti]PFH36539.1 ubiquitin family protein [Besnoitia besnoiti]